MQTPSHDLPANWFAFRLGRLGDVVLCTGVLESLARDFNWSFHVVCKEAFAPLFENNPHIGTIISPQPKDLSLTGWPRFCRGLAAGHSDFGLLDLHGTLRSRLLSLLWQGPVRRYPKMSLERRLFLAGGCRAFSNRLCRYSVPQRYYMAVAEAPPPERLLPRVYLSPEENAGAERRLSTLFGGPVRPVALHPFASHPMKSWSAGRWRQMAALLDGQGIPWIVLGNGAAPSPFAGDARDLCNTSTLRQSCALISRCRALISGDSGPMHLATAVGTPVMALFGPTTREWGFYPAGPGDSFFELPLDCRPCSLHGKGVCSKGGECLDALPPVRILEALLQLKRNPFHNSL